MLVQTTLGILFCCLIIFKIIIITFFLRITKFFKLKKYVNWNNAFVLPLVFYQLNWYCYLLIKLKFSKNNLLESEQKITQIYLDIPKFSKLNINNIITTQIKIFPK